MLSSTLMKSKNNSKRKSLSNRPAKFRKSRLPTPHKGMLGQYGYHDVKFMTEVSRHRALKRAIRGEGFRKTIGHLVLISNYTSRSDPAAYAIFKRDQEWVSMMYKKFKSNQPFS